MSLVDVLPTWLQDTTMGKKLVAEKTANTLAERQEHVAEIERIRAEADEARPPLEKALAAATKHREKAEVAIDKLREAEQVAFVALRSATLRADHAASLHANALAMSAPPEINQFIRKLADMGDATRKMRPRTEESEIDRDEFNRPVLGVTHWSRPSILKRMAAIRQAVEQAEGLKLQATDDVRVAIENIRKSIPDGLEMVKMED